MQAFAGKRQQRRQLQRRLRPLAPCHYQRRYLLIELASETQISST